jgi:serine protease Do
MGKMSDDNKPVPVAQKNSDGTDIARLGIAVSDREPDDAGLVIVEVKSAAARAAGLQAGDVLLAIGNFTLRSVGQLNDLLKQAPRGRSVALLIQRGGGASYLALKLDEK